MKRLIPFLFITSAFGVDKFEDHHKSVLIMNKPAIWGGLYFEVPDAPISNEAEQIPEIPLIPLPPPPKQKTRRINRINLAHIDPPSTTILMMLKELREK